MDKPDQWLSLLANLGVLVGLIFLIIELNQTNRIAIYSAESGRGTQFLDMNTVRIENPEIIAYLVKAARNSKKERPGEDSTVSSE